ncbi:MAG: acetate kinase [Deltaproteobacteria bacterium RIFOXYA12_FULL_61_11]|nr:MAG: acetate kinase [Deltaproteobacteria bacterium RIFOXYA12_FULL_61_11]
MNIFVLNCGSSSLKFQIIATDLEAIEQDADQQLAKGLIERIGSQAVITLQAGKSSPLKEAAPIRDHSAALDYIVKWITARGANIPGIQSLADIHGIGHRVVHGGEKFKKSMLLTPEAIKAIEECIDLAPLHNPANLKGIYAAQKLFGPAVPQVGIFDTAFHSTMDESAYLYAIPYQLYRRFKIRKYGFHGASHRYLAHRYRRITGKSREETKIITVHLGNGASACAIVAGKSIDTSMGMTPLEGLVMGTRSGDIDPTVLDIVAHKEGASFDEVFSLLNKRSGLLGISGLTHDMRDLLEEVEEHDDRRAKLAVDMFCQRVKKYLGAYLAKMNGADAICFTGGIGENAPQVRARICADLDWFGLHLDPEANCAAVGGVERKISNGKSRMELYVIPTNEELIYARDTVRIMMNQQPPG